MKKLLIVLALCMAECKTKVPGTVFCQGFVVKETVLTADGEQLSRAFTLKCNGTCPGGKACEIVEKKYNPALPNGLEKEEWCGCAGDTIPQGCDVVLRTFNINGRKVQQADCTAFNTCPVPSDSCIQMPDKDSRTDTIRTVAGKDSLYKFTATNTCDCVAKQGH